MFLFCRFECAGPVKRELGRTFLLAFGYEKLANLLSFSSFLEMIFLP